MSHPYARSRRVADLIRRELAEILQREAQDPRFRQLTITQVKISRDLQFAKVFINTMDPEEAEEVVYSLNRASGFFRHTLANSMSMRGTPKLKFYVDDRLQESHRIEEIISESKVQLEDYGTVEHYNDED